jgi:hypothetical protein
MVTHHLQSRTRRAVKQKKVDGLVKGLTDARRPARVLGSAEFEGVSDRWRGPAPVENLKATLGLGPRPQPGGLRARGRPPAARRPPRPRTGDSARRLARRDARARRQATRKPANLTRDRHGRRETPTAAEV